VAPWWLLLCNPKHVVAASIILIYFNNSMFFYVMCISWIIKWLIVLMHGYNHESNESFGVFVVTMLELREEELTGFWKEKKLVNKKFSFRCFYSLWSRSNERGEIDETWNCVEEIWIYIEHLIVIIIAFINCNWVVTWWQWLFYMYTNKKVTRKFKSEGLHERHVVAIWKLGNHLSIRL
jgi:hypothetical protein